MASALRGEPLLRATRALQFALDEALDDGLDAANTELLKLRIADIDRALRTYTLSEPAGEAARQQLRACVGALTSVRDDCRERLRRRGRGRTALRGYRAASRTA